MFTLTNDKNKFLNKNLLYFSAKNCFEDILEANYPTKKCKIEILKWRVYVQISPIFNFF